MYGRRFRQNIPTAQVRDSVKGWKLLMREAQSWSSSVCHRETARHIYHLNYVNRGTTTYMYMEITGYLKRLASRNKWMTWSTAWRSVISSEIK